MTTSDLHWREPTSKNAKMCKKCLFCAYFAWFSPPLKRCGAQTGRAVGKLSKQCFFLSLMLHHQPMKAWPIWHCNTFLTHIEITSKRGEKCLFCRHFSPLKRCNRTESTWSRQTEPTVLLSEPYASPSTDESMATLPLLRFRCPHRMLLLSRYWCARHYFKIVLGSPCLLSHAKAGIYQVHETWSVQSSTLMWH